MNRTNRLWSFHAWHTIQRWPGREATKTAAHMIRTPADQKDRVTPAFCEYLQTDTLDTHDEGSCDLLSPYLCCLWHLEFQVVPLGASP
jgi:hypothetical protein